MCDLRGKGWGLVNFSESNSCIKFGIIQNMDTEKLGKREEEGGLEKMRKTQAKLFVYREISIR